MSSTNMTNNQREGLYARSTVTGKQEYLSSTGNILNVNASVSISGVSTAANQTNGAQKTQLVDGSGNVISSTGNALDVNIKSGSPSSVVSTANSSTATLLSGAAFTGTSEDVTTYAEMRVSIFADQASATDGLSFQQSSNGTNWDITDVYTISASTGATFVVPRQAKFFRIVYTNGATNQGVFRLQTILNRGGTAPSSQRPSDGYTNQTDLVQNQVFPMGYNGTTWDRLRATTANGLAVDVTRLPTLAAVTTVSTVTTLTGTTTLTPGTGATNLGKAEDAAHTTGDVGVMALGVRNDTLASTTNASADYTQLSTDTAGIVMTAGAPRALKGTFQVQISASTAETTILAATASTFHDVYGIILANTGATTTKVSIRDATAGTVRMIIEVPTLETRGFMLPVDSAAPQTAVNNNWTAQCGSSTAALEVTGFYVSRV